jgi:hypothetical protein
MPIGETPEVKGPWSAAAMHQGGPEHHPDGR